MIKKFLTILSLSTMVFALPSFAESSGVCNSKPTTTYTCVKSNAWPGPLWAPQDNFPDYVTLNGNCVINTGQVYGTPPGVVTTILDDCKARGGTSLNYSFSSKMPKSTK